MLDLASRTRTAAASAIALFCLALSGGAVAKPIVYLTFDDGPSHDDVTDRILETLDYHGIKATFFVLGSRVRMAPHKLRAIVDAGHAVGNHSHSHRALVKLSNSEVRKELRATAGAVRDAAGIEMHCYRPPFGSFNSRVTSIALAEGLAEMLWTVDTLDWHHNQDRQTIRASLRDASNGSVVLLHDGPANRQSTWEALSTWLAEAVHEYEFAIPADCQPPTGRMIHAAMRQDAPLSEISEFDDDRFNAEPVVDDGENVVNGSVVQWQWHRVEQGPVVAPADEQGPAIGQGQAVESASVAAETAVDAAAVSEKTDEPAQSQPSVADGPLAEVLGKLKQYRVIELY